MPDAVAGGRVAGPLLAVAAAALAVAQFATGASGIHAVGWRRDTDTTEGGSMRLLTRLLEPKAVAFCALHLRGCPTAGGDYSAPTTLKSWLTKTWCGQLTPM